LDVADLMEEAVYLLRNASAKVWFSYLLGGIPFLVMLLLFWTTMSQSPFAHNQLAVYSFLLAFAYFWMKFWQSRFLVQLRKQYSSSFDPERTSSACACFRRQMIVQPAGLFVLPVALISTVFFPSALAFFQNMSACEAIGTDENETLFEKALRYSHSNDKGIFVFALFWFPAITLIVFLNWLTFFIALPFLLYSLLGIDSQFIHSPFAFFNSTFFVMVMVFTYLTVDPFVKVFYLLRCYYQEAHTTGADLRDQIALCRKTKQLILALFIALMTGLAVPSAEAASAEDIEQSIQKVSSQKKYVWRYPPEMVREDQGEPPAIIQSIQDFFQQIHEGLAGMIEDVTHWIRDLFKEKEENQPDVTPDLKGLGALHSTVTVVLIILAIVLLLLIIWIVMQAVIENKNVVSSAGAAISGERPDLNDENTTAADLSTNRWLAYAMELRGKGEWRLALRAIFLAQLALLADQRLLSLARFKSNRDYELELARRAHVHPEKLTAFQLGRSLFESRWYGNYLATEQDVDHLMSVVVKEVPL